MCPKLFKFALILLNVTLQDLNASVSLLQLKLLELELRGPLVVLGQLLLLLYWGVLDWQRVLGVCVQDGQPVTRGAAYFQCCLSLAKVKLMGWERCGLNTQYFASLLGCTPLHSAAYIGSTATVKLLFEFQAEPKENSLGMRPEDVARRKGFTYLLPELSTFYV
ncbi:unnamed protein product [Effrenium voratum]|nr:unnamed protein product [Effrenium voratum]